MGSDRRQSRWVVAVLVVALALPGCSLGNKAQDWWQADKIAELRARRQELASMAAQLDELEGRLKALRASPLADAAPYRVKLCASIQELELKHDTNVAQILALGLEVRRAKRLVVYRRAPCQACVGAPAAGR